MSHHHILVETERAMQNRVTSMHLDFESAHAVSSIYRAANAARHQRGVPTGGHLLDWFRRHGGGLNLGRSGDPACCRGCCDLQGHAHRRREDTGGEGWMEKLSRMDDRRLVELRLTPAGRELMENLYPKFNAIEASVVKGMSSSQKQEMTATLRSVVNALEGSGLDTSQGSTPITD